MSNSDSKKNNTVDWLFLGITLVLVIIVGYRSCNKVHSVVIPDGENLNSDTLVFNSSGLIAFAVKRDYFKNVLQRENLRPSHHSNYQQAISYIFHEHEAKHIFDELPEESCWEPCRRHPGWWTNAGMQADSLKERFYDMYDYYKKCCNCSKSQAQPRGMKIQLPTETQLIVTIESASYRHRYPPSLKDHSFNRKSAIDNKYYNDTTSISTYVIPLDPSKLDVIDISISAPDSYRKWEVRYSETSEGFVIE